MTKFSENRLFDTMDFDFDFAALASDRVHQFSFAPSGWPLWHGLLITMAWASITSWAGLCGGRWLRSVQR